MAAVRPARAQRRGSAARPGTGGAVVGTASASSTPTGRCSRFCASSMMIEASGRCSGGRRERRVVWAHNPDNSSDPINRAASAPSPPLGSRAMRMPSSKMSLRENVVRGC
jgi:hypothetical protein